MNNIIIALISFVALFIVAFSLGMVEHPDTEFSSRILTSIMQSGLMTTIIVVIKISFKSRKEG